MKLLATNIKWDTDGDKELLKQLPKQVEIPSDILNEFISDYLSDKYGFCHFGFGINIV